MNALDRFQKRTAELVAKGMDFDSAMRAATFELSREVEEHREHVPECHSGCNDSNCPYIH